MKWGEQFIMYEIELKKSNRNCEEKPIRLSFISHTSYLIFFLNISYLISVLGCTSSPKAIPTVKNYRLDFDAKPKVNITEKEMIEDLTALKYLITTSYIGYDTAVENGFDIDKAIEEIRTETMKKADRKGMVSTSDFQRQIYEVFKREIGVTDNHFGIFGFGDYGTATTKYVRWSGIYFEKIDGEYFVKKITDDLVEVEKKKKNEKDGKPVTEIRKIENVKVGGKYTGIEKNLYKAILDGEILYRYGVLTDMNLTTLTISIDGEQQTIPVQKRSEFTSINGYTNLIETEKSVYVALDSFMMRDIVAYKKFEELCDSLKVVLPDKNLILDLRPNRGGDATLASQLAASIYFPKSANRDEHFRFYEFTLNEQAKFKKKIMAPAYKQYREHFKEQFEAMEKRPDEYFRDIQEIMSKNTDDFEIYQTPSEFKGKIYILLSPNSASASEYVTALLHLAKDADITLVGENSCGAVDFVYMASYPLPNTAIGIYIGMAEGAPPCITKNPHFMGETNGYFPDYWVTNENLLPALIFLTGDESLSERLAGLEKRQL